MKNLRTHGKSTIVWLLLGLMVLGLGGFGVTSFSGGSSEIGSVGETKVTAEEYARALRGQMIAIQQQTGQPLTMAQAQSLGLQQSVQAQLFTAAALEEQARRMGVSVGDEAVRQTILGAEAFKGPNGKFDRTAYSQALRRESMAESDFEDEVRKDEARLMIQRAVAGGVVAPQAMVDRAAAWILEARDLSWAELTAEDLPAAIEEPDEKTLKAWHQANADRFTAPEARKITYVWLTPEMMSDQVKLDEAALRAVYDERIDEFQQPERRLVSRLVFPSEAEAKAAKDQIDAGTQPFEAFVIQRGLTMDSIDLGEMTRQQLGAAGDAVFALDGPGVVGPVQTDLGPALFSMNAILDPINISFDEAKPDLRQEAAIDRAQRMIDDNSADYEDMLAGGATLEEVAQQTPMELGQIDWVAGETPGPGGIDGYQAFRDRAEAVSESDFPEIERLDDGGIFALRLDEVVPATLKPFEAVRDAVAEDWRLAETRRQLLALAEEEKLRASAAAEPGAEPQPLQGAGGVVQNSGLAPNAAGDNAAADPATQDPAPLEWTSQTGLTRDGWIDNLPRQVVAQAFALKEPGEIEVVDADERVFLVRLDAVQKADLDSEDARGVKNAIASRMGQSLQDDIFDYYSRAAQRQGGLQINQQAINAINAQVQ
ncbi:SurA N-terminal domain-containing protein [Paracoccus sp. (in: a-proteobacteria)]|uniref:SurA N-terminal domain-containing protein n=1 Tax=Paracoccus sp. TaxID=267 RepID=UPI00268AF3A2